MYIRIIGHSFTENVFKEIAVITDQSRLYFKKVTYDDKSRIISLPIRRYRVIGKRRFLGSVTPYRYDFQMNIESLIVIRNIKDCKIGNIIDDASISEVTICQGLSVKNSTIFINSAEEHKGEPCWAMDLVVGEIDIEISDKIES